MFARIFLLSLTSLLLLNCKPTELKIPGIKLSNISVRSAPRSLRTTAGYLTIANYTAKPDVLIKVESSAAERIEIHRMTEENLVMKMRPMQRLELPPGSEIDFAKQDMHLMFMGLKKDLKPGSVLDLTLRFQKAGDIQIKANVKAVDKYK